MTARLGPPLVVAALTAAVFHPAVRFEFLTWDDVRNLSAIPGFSQGTARDLSWIVTTHVMGHWVPLTWASFALDYAIWGTNPAGYHATSIALHCLNAVLVYLTARRLLHIAGLRPGRATQAGAFVAALAFGIHPMRVESVAWVTERRDVLSGVFFLLTVLAYLRAVDANGAAYRRWLALAVGAAAGALLAKQITITLPLVLFLLDVYPLRRLSQAPARVLAEKTPFVVLAAGGVGLLAWTMASDVGFTPLGHVPIRERLALVSHAVVFYPIQTLLPIDVSPLYEVPARVDLGAPRFAASALAAAVVTAVAIGYGRRRPWFAVAWAYAVISTLPVSGLLHAAGQTLVAARYSYLSTLGWAVLAGGGVAVLLGGRVRRRLVLPACSTVAGLLVAWMWLTWFEVHNWRDGLTLWRAAATRDPQCAGCRAYLAVELLNARRPAEAEQAAAVAVALRPDIAIHHAILAAAYSQQQRFDLAVSALRLAHRLRPPPGTAGQLVEALQALAARQVEAGRLGDAERTLEEAIGVMPDNATLRERLADLRARHDQERPCPAGGCPNEPGAGPARPRATRLREGSGDL
jgi:protein O-mannosyl-transferase